MCKLNLTEDQKSNLECAAVTISIVSGIIGTIFGILLFTCIGTGNSYCPQNVTLRDCATGDKFSDWQCCANSYTYCPCGYQAPTTACTSNQYLLYSLVMIGMCILFCPSMGYGLNYAIKRGEKQRAIEAARASVVVRIERPAYAHRFASEIKDQNQYDEFSEDG